MSGSTARPTTVTRRRRPPALTVTGRPIRARAAWSVRAPSATSPACRGARPAAIVTAHRPLAVRQRQQAGGFARHAPGGQRHGRGGGDVPVGEQPGELLGFGDRVEAGPVQPRRRREVIEPGLERDGAGDAGERQCHGGERRAQQGLERHAHARDERGREAGADQHARAGRASPGTRRTAAGAQRGDRRGRERDQGERGRPAAQQRGIEPQTGLRLGGARAAERAERRQRAREGDR